MVSNEGSSPNLLRDLLSEVSQNMHKYSYQVGIQYLKEMSVSSPKTPTVFNSPEELSKHATKFDINVSVIPQNENSTLIETVIKLVGHSYPKDGGDNGSNLLYSLTIAFGCLTQIKYADGVDPSSIPPYADLQVKRYIAAVETPYLLFPSVRHQVLFVTREMSFMPVQLNNVNFQDLFLNNLKKERAEHAS